MSFAQRTLRRSGLDKERRRLVIAATGGDYEVKKIENSLLQLFRGIEKEDRKFVSTRFGKGKGKTKSKFEFGGKARENLVSILQKGSR